MLISKEKLKEFNFLTSVDQSEAQKAYNLKDEEYFIKNYNVSYKVFANEFRKYMNILSNKSVFNDFMSRSDKKFEYIIEHIKRKIDKIKNNIENTDFCSLAPKEHVEGAYKKLNTLNKELKIAIEHSKRKHKSHRYNNYDVLFLKPEYLKYKDLFEKHKEHLVFYNKFIIIKNPDITVIFSLNNLEIYNVRYLSNLEKDSDIWDNILSSI